MTWTRLVYGTSVLLVLVAGLSIYQGANRTIVRAVDMVELVEGARERLMPFGYSAATNVLIYEQALWRPMQATNTWQLGSDSNRTYLAFNGIQSCTVQVINSSSYLPSGTNSAWMFRWFDEDPYWFGEDFGSVPGPEQVGMSGDHVWKIDAVQTGRTFNITAWGETNEVPAYVFVPHTAEVGVYNAKSTLDWIDSVVMGVITGYVDHEAAVSGMFTQQTYALPTLSASQVWTRLHLPYIWTNVSRTVTNTYTNWVDSWTDGLGIKTNVTRIGTNATWNVSTNITTNYTFTSGPIVTTNMLWERYRVMQYLRWTKQDASQYVEYPAWTNSELAAGTNLFWNDYPETNYSFTTEGAWFHNDPPWEVPTHPWEYPEWWDYSASNGPPGGWWAPLETPFWDDDVEVGTYNPTNGHPYKSASAAAWHLKYQGYAVEAHYSWFGYYRWIYTKGQHLEGHTIVEKKKARPVLNIPFNPAKVPVTADLYFKLRESSASSAPDNPTPYVYRTNLVAGAYVTNSDGSAFAWIGEQMDPDFDLFVPSNKVFFSTAWYGWANDQGSINGYYGLNVSNGSAFVGSGYSCGRTVEVIGNGVVLKWQFSRCAP